MHDIRRNGWAQFLWLVTFGWARGRPYPELVQREADNRGSGPHSIRRYT